MCSLSAILFTSLSNSGTADSNLKTLEMIVLLIRDVHLTVTEKAENFLKVMKKQQNFT